MGEGTVAAISPVGLFEAIQAPSFNRDFAVSTLQGKGICLVRALGMHQGCFGWSMVSGHPGSCALHAA